MKTRLQRQVGPWGAVSLGLGSMLGTGVFVSLALAAEIAGGFVLLAVPVAAAVAWCNARSSARLAARFPVSGGTYEYGHRLLSPIAGFTAGWLFLCAKTASAAAACLGVGIYLPNAAGANDALAMPVALMVLALLTAGVLAGIRRTTWLNTALVAVTVMALLAVVICGFAAAITGASERTVLGRDVGLAAVLHASALVFVAFTGYGRLATLGEEVRNPRRAIPWAINSTVLITALIYWAVAAAGIAALGSGGFGLGLSGAPLEAVARPAGGNAVAGFVAVGAITAMLGVTLNLILGLSRVAMAMGRRRELSAALEWIDRRGNPATAVVAVAVAVGIVILSGGIRTAWSFSAVTVLLYYAITNVAAMRLQDGGGRFIPALGLCGCLGLAAFVDLWSWLAAGAVVAVGLVVRGIGRR
jgi:APA family basic amino acid/polyamine antiporter